MMTLFTPGNACRTGHSLMGIIGFIAVNVFLTARIYIENDGVIILPACVYFNCSIRLSF